MFCGKCGKKSYGRSRFCGSCGAPIRTQHSKKEIMLQEKEPIASIYRMLSKNPKALMIAVLVLAIGVVPFFVMSNLAGGRDDAPMPVAEEPMQEEWDVGEWEEEMVDSFELESGNIVSLPLSTYNFFLENRDGYQIEIKVNMGQWIRAENTDYINKSWANVGGTGDVPNHVPSYIPRYPRRRFETAENVFLVFGNIQFTNVTSGFDIGNTNPVRLDVFLRGWINDFDKEIIGNIVVRTSSNSFHSYSALTGNRNARSGQFRFHTNPNHQWDHNKSFALRSNVTQVPFILAIYTNPPTPNNPDVLEDVLDQIVWTVTDHWSSDALGDVFVINKSWLQ